MPLSWCSGWSTPDADVSELDQCVVTGPAQQIGMFQAQLTQLEKESVARERTSCRSNWRRTPEARFSLLKDRRLTLLDVRF